eukprot:NODE_40_length_35084_cov_0.543519.p17 type:complete len:231 gc:universal NODE_40_length_35084_cov_0.543519:5066-4374(-)
MGSSSSDSENENWKYFENSKLRPAIPELSILTPNDQVSIQFIIQSVASHRNWNYDNFKQDVDYLIAQNILTISDLHVLRKSSFEKLQIKIILKDLLFKISIMSFKYLKKGVKSVSYGESKEEGLVTAVENEKLTPAQIAKSMLTGSTINAAVQVTNIQISPNNPKNLIVNANGINYECMRYCPHKNVDMLHGYVEGNNLICQKHGWAFDLKNGGLCKEKNKTVNACKLEW